MAAIETIIDLSTQIKSARDHRDRLIDKHAKVLRQYSEERREARELVDELESRLRELLASDDPEESEPAPELTAGQDTGSHTKTRPWRYRHDQYGGLEKEYIYRGAAYLRQAEILKMGTHDRETKVVWLTEDEIESVREACYKYRVARGLTAGVPRSWRNGLGGK
tara:strand:+ start:2196 stop:2690 length:495 start_codon:yes stop_codon:yes gene_type:complete